jgi:hypothetical protein
MRKSRHQDYEVIDIFGFKDIDDNDVAIKEKLVSLFGNTLPYHYFGNIESVINKEGAVVCITSSVYKIILEKQLKVLSNYTDDVVETGDSTFWLHKDEIKNETRLREGDKKILERVFEDRSLDIKIIEDQGERWIDAKTTLFEDR